jgi:hypothetical protein
MLLQILRCALEDKRLVWEENLEKAASSNPPKKQSRLRHHLVTQPTSQYFIGNSTDAKMLLRILRCAQDDKRLVWE